MKVELQTVLKRELKDRHLTINGLARTCGVPCWGRDQVGIGKTLYRGFLFVLWEVPAKSINKFRAEFSYDRPSGFGVTLGWGLTSRLSIIVTGKQINYSEWVLSGSNLNITSDTLTQLSYGVGLSYALF